MKCNGKLDDELTRDTMGYPITEATLISQFQESAIHVGDVCGYQWFASMDFV